VPFGEPLRGRIRHGLKYLGLPIVHPLLGDPALLSFLGFEEGSGSTARDSLVWTIADTTKVLWVSGKVGGGLRFLGYPKGYISTPYIPSLDLQAFSIAIWIKVAPGTGLGQIYNRQRTVSGIGYGVWLAMRGTGKIFFGIQKGDGDPGTYKEIEGVTDIRDNSWHHIIATYDGANLQVFIDNASEAIDSWTATIGYTTVGGFIAANTSGMSCLVCTMDEFYLFSKVLSASERTLLYEV